MFRVEIPTQVLYLTLSWQRFLSYWNQSIDLQNKSMNWFLYGRDLRHERVKDSKILKFFERNGLAFSIANLQQSCCHLPSIAGSRFLLIARQPLWKNEMFVQPVLHFHWLWSLSYSLTDITSSHNKEAVNKA